MTQSALPDDVLHLLCEELANQEQFDTLFNCACASRALAVPALTYLYKYVALGSLIDRHFTNTSLRSHHLAPVRGGGEDLYGLDLCIELAHRWKLQNTKLAMVFVVSSLEKNEEYYNESAAKVISLGISDRFLLVKEPISFVSLIHAYPLSP